MDFKMIKADPRTERGELQEIWGKCFPHDAFFGDDTWLDPLIETWWIVVGGVKVGFTTFQLHATVAHIYDQDSLQETGTMYILVVALISEFRYQGLGTQVKRWHIEHARERGGIKKLVSNHRVSNTASQSFNLKAGYCLVRVISNYYPAPEPEDSNVMEFVL